MPSRIPLYGLEDDAPQTISRQAAKLLVKQGRAHWIDPRTRELGIVAFPKTITVRASADGRMTLGSADAQERGHGAHPQHYRERPIRPPDILVWALGLPPTYPKRSDILSQARQQFDAYISAIN